MLKLAGHPKILFLSQESSPEVVQETLGMGALGYVYKLRAGTDLLPAIDAVLEGMRFVSRGLKSHESSSNSNAKPAKKLEVPTRKRHRSRERARRTDAPKYPWQRVVMEAFHSPRESLPQKLNIAERTIAERLTNRAQPSIEERLALKDALRSLRVLNAETRLQPKTNEKKEIA